MPRSSTYLCLACTVTKYNRDIHLSLLEKNSPALARSALWLLNRAGAGLTSLISSPKNASIISPLLPASCLVRTITKMEGIAQKWKASAALIGPGSSVTERTARHTLQLLDEDIPVLIDADALTVFQKQPDLLVQSLTRRKAATVLTPHLGEFSRIFPDINGENKVEKALAAARRSHTIIVLKGPDTVIASPDGQAVINPTASAYLAIGGSGDVLGGIIISLLAQGMSAFNAACAGVHIHSLAAQRAGVNLIPEDLIAALPAVCEALIAKDPLSSHH